MRSSFRLFIILALLAVGWLIYAAYPILIYGLRLAFMLLTAAVSALLTLPHLLWWLVGALVLSFLCFKRLFQWGRTLFRRSSGLRSGYVVHGRLNELHERLEQANDGLYSRERIREFCGVLAVDLIALKRAVPKEEARKLFSEGAWTRDEFLKDYFAEDSRSKDRDSARRFSWGFKKNKAPGFLEKTRKTITLLKHYRDETNGTEINLVGTDD